ncbi:prepilin peptidase-dependent protein [Candidatus Pantoea multigeneris]
METLLTRFRAGVTSLVWKMASCHASCMKNTHQGFTLLELLVVVAIIAVLSTSGMHGWQRWQQQQQLKQTAQQLQAWLLRLRAEANALNRDLTVWSEPGTLWCIGVGARQQGCHQPSRHHFLPAFNDIRLESLRGEPGFYGLRDTAKAGHIELSNPAGRVRVVISVRGRVRLCQPKEAGCE